MFSSSEWDECKWSKTVKGQASYNTVMAIGFWNGVTSCLTVFAPLVKVLRIADADRKPSMGFLYGELQQAKEDIKNALNNYSKNYDPILDIMDAKIKGRVDTPLHLMAYLLNPYYHYKDPNIILDQVISDGVLDCLDIICHGNFDLMNKVMNVELPIYKTKGGVFAKPIAAKGSNWWLNYGHGTPNLQRIAIRILSLTTSSSGCERNWSAFEGIHTKKRNRLDVSRLNNLVYVQFNSRLLNKRKRGKEKDVDVLLASDASKAQDWIIPRLYDDEDELGDGIDGDTSRVRELEEDDFESEDEEEVNENDFEFESDEERVLENYGEEEEDPFGIATF
ncbi:hypothetical protein DH2020_040686 [Rehmannia glutinosa]|uniref:HAT C-terminal dimerisation domain-containing protein n=1 Tax=Rehmannia glutinosa TaxID=99300 RepID=A0ABR0US80_REHGL